MRKVTKIEANYLMHELQKHAGNNLPITTLGLTRRFLLPENATVRDYLQATKVKYKEFDLGYAIVTLKEEEFEPNSYYAKSALEAALIQTKCIENMFTKLFK